MDLIDTHAHLEDLTNLDGVRKRAEQIGISAIISMGSDHESNLWVLREHTKHKEGTPKVYVAIGLHPWGLDPSKIDLNIRLIEENIHAVSALGEIGLDYWYRDVRKDAEKKRQQRELFQRLLMIAKKNDKPVSIHSRGAWEDCLEIATQTGIRRAVFHWFSGSLDVLKCLLDHGYYVSATPAVAYSKEHRLAIENTPLERLVLETDSPVAYKGEPSEPSHLLKTLSAVALLKDENEEKVAEQTTGNARLIFGIQ